MHCAPNHGCALESWGGTVVYPIASLKGNDPDARPCTAGRPRKPIHSQIQAWSNQRDPSHAPGTTAQKAGSSPRRLFQKPSDHIDQVGAPSGTEPGQNEFHQHAVGPVIGAIISKELERHQRQE
eukprot:UN2306